MKTCSHEVVVNARDIMQYTPSTTVRQLRPQMDQQLSNETTHTLLRKNLHVYSYCVTAVQ